MINLLLAILQANLLLAKYLNTTSSDYHRLFANWQTIDLISLVFLHLMLILILFLLFRLINSKRIKSLLTITYLLCYIGFPTNLGFRKIVILFLVLSICFFLIPRFEQYLMTKQERILQALTIASSIFIIFFYFSIIFNPAQKFTRSYSGDIKTGSKDTNNPNVFFFIFDRLSYQELYKQSNQASQKMNEDFPNFKKFSDDSWNFHSAFSAYPSTISSIPILLGLDKDKSLIDIFNERNMNTYIFGHYINYCDLFKDLNKCLATNFYRAPAYSNRAVSSIIQHIVFITNTWDLFIDENTPKYLKQKLYARKAYKEQNILEKEVFSFLKTKPQNSFVYIHFNIPHSPHIYTRDGLINKDLLKENIFKPEYVDSDPKATMEQYRNNIYYADTLFGEIMEELKAQGLYDSSIIILSSDHSFPHYWRFKSIKDDFYVLEAYKALVKQKESKKVDLSRILLTTHVPLLIKQAKQVKKEDSESIISNSLLFSEDNNTLFDSNLLFEAERIKKQKDNLIRIPKFNQYFSKELIKNDQLIHKSKH